MGLRRSVAENPVLDTQNISDLFVRSNFQALKNFFQKENQLVGFQHLRLDITEKADNLTFRHGLKYVPQDVIVTRITGEGTLTLNWDLFDQENINVSASGPLRARLFVGTYAGDTGGDATSEPVGTQEFLAAAASGATDGANLDLSLFPVGTPLNWYGPAETIPENWCERDGRTLEAVAYPELFAILGYAHGGAAGQFRVPDTRGYFERHIDPSGALLTPSGLVRDPSVASRQQVYTGGNTGAKVGTYQDDGFENHAHSYYVYVAAPVNFSGTYPPPCPPGTLATRDTLGAANGRAAAETRSKSLACIGIIKIK